MNIILHIERLVLEGLPLTSCQSAVIQAAIERELTRRLVEAGLPPMTSTTWKNISGDPIQLTADQNPVQTGRQIAGAVHSALISGRAEPRPMTTRGGGRQ